MGRNDDADWRCSRCAAVTSVIVVGGGEQLCESCDDADNTSACEQCGVPVVVREAGDELCWDCSRESAFWAGVP